MNNPNPEPDNCNPSSPDTSSRPSNNKSISFQRHSFPETASPSKGFPTDASYTDLRFQIPVDRTCISYNIALNSDSSARLERPTLDAERQSQSLTPRPKDQIMHRQAHLSTPTGVIPSTSTNQYVSPNYNKPHDFRSPNLMDYSANFVRDKKINDEITRLQEDKLGSARKSTDVLLDSLLKKYSSASRISQDNVNSIKPHTLAFNHEGENNEPASLKNSSNFMAELMHPSNNFYHSNPISKMQQFNLQLQDSRNYAGHHSIRNAFNSYDANNFSSSGNRSHKIIVHSPPIDNSANPLQYSSYGENDQQDLYSSKGHNRTQSMQVKSSPPYTNALTKAAEYRDYVSRRSAQFMGRYSDDLGHQNVYTSNRQFINTSPLDYEKQNTSKNSSEEKVHNIYEANEPEKMSTLSNLGSDEVGEIRTPGVLFEDEANIEKEDMALRDKKEENILVSKENYDGRGSDRKALGEVKENRIFGEVLNENRGSSNKKGYYMSINNTGSKKERVSTKQSNKEKSSQRFDSNYYSNESFGKGEKENISDDMHYVKSNFSRNKENFIQQQEPLVVGHVMTSNSENITREKPVNLSNYGGLVERKSAKEGNNMCLMKEISDKEVFYGNEGENFTLGKEDGENGNEVEETKLMNTGEDKEELIENRRSESEEEQYKDVDFEDKKVKDEDYEEMEEKREVFIEKIQEMKEQAREVKEIVLEKIEQFEEKIEEIKNEGILEKKEVKGANNSAEAKGRSIWEMLKVSSVTGGAILLILVWLYLILTAKIDEEVDVLDLVKSLE